MKIFSIIGIALFLLTGFTSCTIEKRHYRNGFYVDWKNNSVGSTEVAALNAPGTHADISVQVPEAEDTVLSVLESDPAVEQVVLVAGKTHVKAQGVAKQESSEITKQSSQKRTASLQIEKDKKQATGAGIAAAIFFILGMLGLIIKGVGGPAGVFIVAAFVCFLLCVILASFLYPRDPVVKQPKDDQPSHMDNATKIGLGFVLLTMSIVFAIFVSVLAAFTSVFY